MLKNYYILTGLIGIYLMIKTNDPVVILVVGILSMFCFTLGFSDRPKLNDGQKFSLWIFRGVKLFFSFFVSIPIIIIISLIGYHEHPFILSYFISYQLVSFFVWKAWRKYRGVSGLFRYLD